LAGLAFGAVKGALILSVLLVIFDKIDEDVHIISADTKSQSRLYTPIRNFAPGVFPFLDFSDKGFSKSSILIFGLLPDPTGLQFFPPHLYAI
jgi:hypothetical protein